MGCCKIRRARFALCPLTAVPARRSLTSEPPTGAGARVTQLLAADEALRARGISVVAVCPGWCATDMGNSADVPGGAAPPRSAGQGADSILLAADADAVANGSFTRDGETEEWGDAPAVPPPVEVGASA
jgi:NAD(P)-dependent dehydrogenase (short-subunit alcohol dehydrogenase family)